MTKRQRPAFVLFDYGQTLVTEGAFDCAKGFDAILPMAASNPHGVTGEELEREMDTVNAELGRFVSDPAMRHKRLTEIPEAGIWYWLFARYGVTFDCDLRELEPAFWNAANPCRAVDGIADVLAFLKEEGIGTGVVSNLSFCGRTLRARIAGCIPDADFSFVISSCDYLFRKPSRRIFDAALGLTGLTADRVWFCGDQLVPDIQGSTGAGMTAVWYKGNLRYDHTAVAPEGTIEISQWQDLIDLLREIA